MQSSQRNDLRNLMHILNTDTKHIDEGLWEQHRWFIQKFLDEAFENSPENPSVLVIGPGNCNDINLEFLLHNSGRLDLLDIDGDAVHHALNQYPTLKSKASVIECDITSLTEAGFDAHFLMDLLRDRDVKKFASEMTRIFKRKKRQVAALEGVTYDIVIALPVFTQLLSPFFHTNAVLVWGSEADAILETYGDTVRSISDDLSTEVLNMCWDCLKDNGYLFVSTDLFDFYDEPWKQHFRPFNDADTFLNLVRDILKNVGVLHGASGVLKWVKDHHGTYEFVVSRHWLWYFTARKVYVTYGVMVRKPTE